MAFPIVAAPLSAASAALPHWSAPPQRYALRRESAPWQAPLLIAALMVVALTLATPAQSNTLELHQAEAMALDAEPTLLRRQALADAYQEEATAAGALPDPELNIGYQNLPVDSLSPRDEMMSMAMISVRQRFPAGDTRALRRQSAEQRSQLFRHEHAAQDLAVRRAAQQSWLRWYYAHARLQLAEESIDTLAELMPLIDRRVAAGTADQQDQALVRLELADLRQRQLAEQTALARARAQLERWLQQPVDDRTPGTIPAWPAPDRARLETAIDSHPALQVADAEAQESDLAVALAEQAYKPEWMVELGYAHRRGRDMDGRRSDLVSGMVGISLPLFQGGRQDPARRAAEHQAIADRLARQDLARQLHGEFRHQLALWQYSAQQLDFYHQELLPAAHESAEATERAYRSDRATADELIRLRLRIIDLQMEVLNRAEQRDLARTELFYFAAESLPGAAQ